MDPEDDGPHTQPDSSDNVADSAVIGAQSEAMETNSNNEVNPDQSTTQQLSEPQTIPTDLSVSNLEKPEELSAETDSHLGIPKSERVTPIRELPRRSSDDTENANSFLYSVLLPEEYINISSDVRQKIEKSIEEKGTVEQARLHTLNSQQDELVKSLQVEIAAQNEKVGQLQSECNEAKAQVVDIRARLESAVEEVCTARESCKRMQYEWQDFKTQRDLARDEKESLLTMVERRNNEVATLREEKAELVKKCEAAVLAKIKALDNAQEVASMRINLEHKEKRLDQDNAMLRSRVEALNEELEDKIMEISRARSQVATQSMTLESELAAKTEEVRILIETVTDLRETNNKQSDEMEKLINRNSKQRDAYDKQIEEFHQELNAQRKCAMLYKGLSDDNETKTEKLTQAYDELKKQLALAIERYGELENDHREKMEKMKKEIEKRDECIQHLKRELVDANELLEAAKQESKEDAISSLSPCAAATSRLIKEGMTLTQIFTQYARANEELALAKEENRRLNLYVTTIVKEIEEKAPLLMQQRKDYEKAVAVAESMTQTMDQMVTQSQLLNDECADAKKISGHLKRENERLRKELVDLSRQVCYLVKAVEEARGGVVSHDTAYDASTGSAEDVINRHLVTFASITDLQKNNQKLLAVVRQLSERQEEAETVTAQQYQDLQAQKDRMEQQLNGLIEEISRQTKMIDLVRSQSDTYKKLYQQAMGGNAVNISQEAPAAINAPAAPDVVMADVPSTPMRASANLVTSTPLPVARQQQPDSDLQKKLNEANEKILKLKEELDESRRKTRDVEEKLTAKLDKVSEEAKDWLYKNSKLVGQAEYHEEKSKILDTNVKSLRKQLAALEERNKMVSEICAKHEMSIFQLREEATNAQTRLARAEVQRNNLQEEVHQLKINEARLIKDQEAMKRERINNNMLMNNLEGLKATLDRSEAEGRLRLEMQLSESVKECAALRSSLKEEKANFKTLTDSLERQTAAAKKRMLEEQALAERARADFDKVRNELETKALIITELNKQITDLESLPVKIVDASAEKVKGLEKKIADQEAEIARLEIQLTEAQACNSQYINMSEVVKMELEQFKQQRQEWEDSTARNHTLKEKEWSDEIVRMTGDLRAAVEQKDQALAELAAKEKSIAGALEQLNKEITTVQADLDEKRTDLNTARGLIYSLTNELAKTRDELKETIALKDEMENKYSQEVVEHGKAIESLAAVRKDLDLKILAEKSLRAQLDEAQVAIAANVKMMEGRKAELHHLNEREKELQEHNTSLHNTMAKLNEEIRLLQARVASRDTSELDIAVNTSGESTETAHEDLLKVIGFLRKERDVAVANLGLVQAESTRVKAEEAKLQKELKEKTLELQKSRDTTAVTQIASAKHIEMLRQVESLNAMTDSNRMLREERDRYKEELIQVKDQLSQFEKGINPLQAEINQLKKRIESANTDKEATLLELSRWKARAVQLSERDKIPPEEMKRVTAERDSLQRLLQEEKTTNEQLRANVKKLDQDISNLNGSLNEVKKKLAAVVDEKCRLNEELASARQRITQLEGDLRTASADVESLKDELQKSKSELTTKDENISQIMSKELQIKKIAKKYKTSFEELQRTMNEEKAKREAEDAKPLVIPEDDEQRLRAEGRAEVAAQIAELEIKMAEEIKQLKEQVTAAQEESETLRKDNASLKGSISDKEERAKQLVKTARSKMDQMKAENDKRCNALNEASLLRLNECQEERDRLANQVKALTLQLQRSLDKPKPSTSSQPQPKNIIEPPTPPTANIKPMAGSSSQRQQKPTPAQCVGPYWPSASETPFARIGPVQTRTVAVLPTSVGGAASAAPATIVTALQQVHTTGTSGEAMSSSPTSSHTDYMPATSSATPIRVVVAPTPQPSQDVEAETEMPQTVALVTPRLEAQAVLPTEGPSSTGSQASSSNTVTTTQAGLKRPRDAEAGAEGDTKSIPLVKRARGQFHVTPSEGSEVEYQVPTSSQRDQEDDIIMLVDSEDERDPDDGEAEEGEGCFEEEDNGDAYVLEGYSREERDLGGYEEGPDIDEDLPEDGNEVEIIDDSNEVPAQQQQSSEATSSGNDNNHHVVVSHAASSQSFRTRSVAPLSRAQQSLQGYEEGGDDSIVPSTPTLFLSREAVSSPQVPHQRFVFSEPTGGLSRRDDVAVEDAGSARSVPSTPIVSPPDAGQELVEPSASAVPNIPLQESRELPPSDLSDVQDDQDLPASRRQDDHETPETVDLDEDGDGVTSEGEKPPAVSGEFLEEGREAEASEPMQRPMVTTRRTRQNVARRGTPGRPSGRPIPIVFNEPGSSGLPSNQRATRGAVSRRSRRNWQ